MRGSLIPWILLVSTIAFFYLGFIWQNYYTRDVRYKFTLLALGVINAIGALSMFGIIGRI